MKKAMFFNYSYGKPRMTPRLKVATSENKPRTTWIRNTDYKAYVSFISLRTCTTDFWYFDSGCSRHMTNDRSEILVMQPKSGGELGFWKLFNSKTKYHVNLKRI